MLPGLRTGAAEFPEQTNKQLLMYYTGLLPRLLRFWDRASSLAEYLQAAPIRMIRLDVGRVLQKVAASETAHGLVQAILGGMQVLKHQDAAAELGTCMFWVDASGYGHAVCCYTRDLLVAMLMRRHLELSAKLFCDRVWLTEMRSLQVAGTHPAKLDWMAKLAVILTLWKRGFHFGGMHHKFTEVVVVEHGNEARDLASTAWELTSVLFVSETLTYPHVYPAVAAVGSMGTELHFLALQITTGSYKDLKRSASDFRAAKEKWASKGSARGSLQVDAVLDSAGV